MMPRLLAAAWAAVAAGQLLLLVHFTSGGCPQAAQASQAAQAAQHGIDAPQWSGPALRAARINIRAGRSRGCGSAASGWR